MMLRNVFSAIAVAWLTLSSPVQAQVAAPAAAVAQRSDIVAAIARDNAARATGLPSTLASDLATILLSNPSLADDIVVLVVSLAPAQQQAAAAAFGAVITQLGSDPAAQAVVNAALVESPQFSALVSDAQSAGAQLAVDSSSQPSGEAPPAAVISPSGGGLGGGGSSSDVSPNQP